MSAFAELSYVDRDVDTECICESVCLFLFLSSRKPVLNTSVQMH